MKSISRILCCGLAAISLSGPATSQTQPSITAPQRPAGEAAMSQAPLLSPSKRAAITHELIAKWQPAAAKRPGGDGPRWAQILAGAVATANAANVLRATTARSVDELHAVLAGANFEAQSQTQNGAIGNGTVSPQVLGSFLNDLVYTPLPNGRCRIADSRVINSPLVGTRNLKLEGMVNFASQGGNGTYANGTGSVACGIPYYPAAYAFSISLISPAASGYFKIFRHGTPYQTGNSISMNAGVTYAGGDLIVRSCQACNAEYSIHSPSSVHYIIDVIGYYMPPVATGLSCMDTTGAELTVAPNALFSLSADACPATFTATSTSCNSLTDDVIYYVQGLGQCRGRNRSGGNAYVTARQRCCQVPGRLP